MVIVSSKPKIPEKCNAFCPTSKANKQNLRDGTLDLPFFFFYKHITSLKNPLSLAQGANLPYWFRGNFCGRVCFDLPVERNSFVCSR